MGTTNKENVVIEWYLENIDFYYECCKTVKKHFINTA